LVLPPRDLSSPRAPFVFGRLSVLHYLGALAVLLYALQVITGVLLMIYYRPSVGAAHSSTAIITDEVNLGWLVRALHHWGAELLIVLALLYLLGLYFSRAYQAPRHWNWTAGVCVLAVLLALGFTGTLLPWDQYAYWYTDSARRSLSGIPVVGNLLLGLFWGGWEIGEAVLLRFYVLHVGVLPWVAVLFLYVHLLSVWRFGMEEPSRATTDPVPFFPDLAVSLFVTSLLAAGVLLSFAVLWPPALLEPANPVAPLAHVSPPWYLASLRGVLRGLPPPAAAVVVLAFTVLLFLVPLLDRRPVAPLWKILLQRGLGLLVISAAFFLTLVGYRR
jgi:quinol-cytochrome oxidoreductase complex cytochrome b subunit